MRTFRLEYEDIRICAAISYQAVGRLGVIKRIFDISTPLFHHLENAPTKKMALGRGNSSGQAYLALHLCRRRCWVVLRQRCSGSDASCYLKKAFI